MSDVVIGGALAADIVQAIHTGDVEELKRLLRDNPQLASSKVKTAHGARDLLKATADWPGHFPNGAETVTVLIAAGADPNPPVSGTPDETALHWAASSDDVAVLDALLDGGANIEAPGEGYTGGAPMANAVIYCNWNAARRLLERGAKTNIWQAAALGLLDRVEECFAEDSPPSAEEVTVAFWYACSGGQQQTAQYLRERGADVNWVHYGGSTSLQAAQDTGNQELCAWLVEIGAKTADEMK